MLRFLSIRHLAVIDALEVEFGPGLTVLTGETGAGKSMFVEALDLLVGGRASADLVRTGESLATVQAIFEKPGGGDAAGREVIVRREISAEGRSRAFIDEALATSGALKELGAGLLELHGQHEHQSLLDPESHGPLLDQHAEQAPRARHREQLDHVARAFAAWREARHALERTQMSDREKAARIELVGFQLAEIDKVAPTPGEDEALSAERAVLANADRLSRLSSEAYALLYDGDAAALASLAAAWKRVAELATIDSRAQPYLDARDAIKSQVEDLAYFLRGYADGLDASPGRLQDVEDRLAAIERLKRKHGPALDDVLARRDALRAELDALGASEAETAALEARLAEARQDFLAGARALSAARVGAAGSLARQLESELASLAMPKCRVEIRIASREADESHWHARGFDAVEFYLSANPGEDLRPLARIASGGELSRVMLALHHLGDASSRPTLVFDEVDAGIGGEAADAVGARLQALAARCQVLCVTHLPQIAARADVHLAIDKRVVGGRTTTSIARLDPSGREQELARMIAGAAVTDLVVASAKEMLAGRRRSEKAAKGESESRQKAKAKGTRGA